MKNRSSSEYQAAGVKIANDFLETGAPMTPALAKVARDMDLNTHQIERVAEHANQHAFRKLFEKRANGGDVQFEPAAAEKVVAECNAPTKVSWDLSDYAARPDAMKTASMGDIIRSQFGDLTALVPELEKQAAFQDSFAPVEGEHQTLEDFEKAAAKAQHTAEWDESNSWDMVTKLAAVVKHFAVERIRILDLAGQEREKFARLCERMVRDGGYKIEDLYKAAMVARPDQADSLKSLFAWVIADLDKKACFGGFKTAASVDPKHISSRLDSLIPPHGVTVVNGSHPVTLSVNIIADLANQWDEANKGHGIAQAALEKAQQVKTSITPRKGAYTGAAKVQGL